MSATAHEQCEGEYITLKPLVDTSEGLTQARLPITWCPSTDMQARLAARRPDRPYLLIVAMRQDENGLWIELSRDLVPLDKSYHVVQFQHPGRNVLKAAVVWPGKDRLVWDLKRYLLACDAEGNFKHPTFDAWEGELLGEFHSGDNRLEGDGELVIDVEAKLVDNKPSSIGMAVAAPANFILKRKPRDPCALRARVLCSIPAWIVLLPVMAVIAVLLLCILVAVELFQVLAIGVLLFFGRRDISYHALRDPIDTEPRDIWRNLGPSVWFTKEVDGKYVPRALFFLIANPPTIAAVAVVALLVNWSVSARGSVDWAVLGYAAGGVLLIAVCAMLIVALLGVNAEANAEAKAQRREHEWQEAEARHRAWVQSLSCDTRVAAAKREYEERSVVLRARDDIKGAVCTPYSS